MTTLPVGDELVLELPEGATSVEGAVDESRHLTPEGLSVVTRAIGPFADREMALGCRLTSANLSTTISFVKRLCVVGRSCSK